jgi:pimeloyl-ACP methyl ester carboxylesterase
MTAAAAQAREVELAAPSGVRLALRASGPATGRPAIGLHGLGGTRDAVLGGSLLARSGLRAIVYDARGHGRSGAPADPADYAYDALVADLAVVLDWAQDSASGPAAAMRPLLVGVSMGALTALRLVLEQPDRVAGLVLVTPAFDPDLAHPVAEHLERAAVVAQALRERDLEAFVAAQPVPVEDPQVAALLAGFAQRQFDSHRDLSALADAIEVVMRARPFASFAQLADVAPPALVVGSHDALDRNHPLRLARAYAGALPGAQLTCEPAGSVPFAWRSRQLSRIALAFAREQRLL